MLAVFVDVPKPSQHRHCSIQQYLGPFRLASFRLEQHAADNANLKETDVDFSKPYEICSPEVVAEDFDGEVVILNLNDGHYFSLNTSGREIWQAILAGTTLQTIIDTLRTAAPSLEVPACEFIKRLEELNLIREAQTNTASRDEPSDLQGWGEEEPPQIDVFDDLADLILADPIHDVDAETGKWPLRESA